jgi:Invasin, domain 3
VAVVDLLPGEPDVDGTMKKNHTIQAAAVVALLAMPFASVSAAGPFQLRKATTAAGVSTAPPAATITVSPYDGEPLGSAGIRYYYGVYDAAGQPLNISVQSNTVTQTVRISFDDANAASAPVNAAASSLTVAPASIQADGLHVATITIVPRDGNGVILGRGLSIAIDPSLLWPAQLAGPVVDLGDGSYRATAAASVPGTGTVRVVVEGTDLAALPTITATAANPADSLRDLGIEQLQGLAGVGGPLAGLAAAAGSGTPQAGALNGAIAAIQSGVTTLANGDLSRDDNVVKTTLGGAISDLENVLNNPGSLNPLDVRDALYDVLGAARLIAEWHVNRATTGCGACDASGNPRKVCDAVTAFQTADAMLAAANPDWGGIADTYARAIELSLQAMQHC